MYFLLTFKKTYYKLFVISRLPGDKLSKLWYNSDRIIVIIGVKNCV